MNSRINEDMAWLRVQDRQREAENRRLVEGAPSSRVVSALRRVIANATSGRAAQGATRPAIKTRHHA